MQSVYVIRSCKNSKLYVGTTCDLKRRVQQHNRGNVKATNRDRPFKLVYKETFHDRVLAMKRKRFFKTGKGREVLRNLITNLGVED